jgi:predicted secreted protein
MVAKAVVDTRSERIVFVSHCILNQNAKVRGIATYPGTFRPVVDLLVSSGVGIVQMPCPEMTYLGATRWGHVRSQYDSPFFRQHCRAIAESMLDQATEYMRNGYQVLAFVMIDGSPACGLSKTPQPADPEEGWGGMVWYQPKSRLTNESGVYCQALKVQTRARGMGPLAFLAMPETEAIGSLETALGDLGRILSR